ncbi:hypothetical protein F5Y19DRAFT_412331 [Xylariaceae sp. FL1651]|nr:hypothetical protein F5Y19DRAFT_412331 [Xylariaceae sp. FL1651]
MSCACRTTSLRIFVQSLTELRLTNYAVTRSTRPKHLGSPVAFRHTPFPPPTRYFNSASVAYSPRQRWEGLTETPSASGAENDLSHASLDNAADARNEDPTTSTLSASGNELARAKNDGTILDFNPESINTLVAKLGQTSITQHDPVLSDHNHTNAHTKPQLSPRAKPPVKSSQLKRLKIIKSDAKPHPSPGELSAAQKEEWQIQKVALKEKFPEGWRPRKRLSPDALDGIRALHAQFPEQYTTEVLAGHFEVSAEAIRRILKSKWTPNPEEEARRQERWFNRGKNIWSQMAELGKKPPRRWRREGVVRKPHWNEKKGPRTEYPYMPRREQSEDQGPVESAQRKLSGNLL